MKRDEMVCVRESERRMARYVSQGPQQMFPSGEGENMTGHPVALRFVEPAGVRLSCVNISSSVIGWAYTQLIIHHFFSWILRLIWPVFTYFIKRRKRGNLYKIKSAILSFSFCEEPDGRGFCFLFFFHPQEGRESTLSNTAYLLHHYICTSEQTG